MKDMVGNEIHVGDEIVYASAPYGSTRLTSGRVKNVTETSITVERFNAGDSSLCVKDGKEIKFRYNRETKTADRVETPARVTHVRRPYTVLVTKVAPIITKRDELLELICYELKIALESFGEYTFNDRGAHEVMDLGYILNKLQDAGPERAANILQELSGLGTYEKRLSRDIVQALDDWDELFDETQPWGLKMQSMY